MARKTPSAPAADKPADPTPAPAAAVEAPSAPSAAPEAPPPTEPAPTPEPAAEAQPEPSPAPSEAPAPDPVAAPDEPAADAPPDEPPMPKPPEDEPALRTDGPTPTEWAEAGYDPAAYPPAGYAAKPDAPSVRYYRVATYCRYVRGGAVSVWNKGLIIDSLTFDIADVKAQGCPIEPCDAPNGADLKPSIGHWSV